MHVGVFAEAAGFSEAQIAATVVDPVDEALWSPAETLLLTAVDELCRDGRMTEVTIEAFETEWSVEAQLEILALCGVYHTVCLVANTAAVPNETFGRPFPTP